MQCLVFKEAFLHRLIKALHVGLLSPQQENNNLRSVHTTGTHCTVRCLTPRETCRTKDGRLSYFSKQGWQPTSLFSGNRGTITTFPLAVETQTPLFPATPSYLKTTPYKLLADIKPEIVQAFCFFSTGPVNNQFCVLDEY